MIPRKPFYFIRHGETEWNKRNVIMGSVDIPLNEAGVAQAKDAGSALSQEDFTVIISSPRKRAFQTAEIIGQKVGKIVIVENDLVERTWGEAEGQVFEPKHFDENYTPAGAETFANFTQRVVSAISSLLLTHELPLIVSHGGVLMALASYFGYTNLRSHNCATFFFKPPQYEKDLWIISHVNGEDNGNT